MIRSLRGSNNPSTEASPRPGTIYSGRVTPIARAIKRPVKTDLTGLSVRESFVLLKTQKREEKTDMNVNPSLVDDIRKILNEGRKQFRLIERSLISL